MTNRATAQLRGGIVPVTTRDGQAVALKHVYDKNPDGSYVYRYSGNRALEVLVEMNDKEIWNFSYETTNGIRADQQGFLKNPGTNLEAQVMQGSYSYTGPDGIVYTITYIADENGFQVRS